MRPAATIATAALLLLATARVAQAQLPDRIERQAARSGYVNLTGPRAGILYLAGDKDRLRDNYDVDHVVTQLGVSFERRAFAVPSGPSCMLLFGLRSQGGMELSIGPWFAEHDAAPVVQIGAVLPAGYMRIPFHVQLMPTNNGVRVGFLTGFNALR